MNYIVGPERAKLIVILLKQSSESCDKIAEYNIIKNTIERAILIMADNVPIKRAEMISSILSEALDKCSENPKPGEIFKKLLQSKALIDYAIRNEKLGYNKSFAASN